MESRLHLDPESLKALAGRIGVAEMRLEGGLVAFGVGGTKLEVSGINVAMRVTINGLPVDVKAVSARPDGLEVRFAVVS